MDPSQDCCVVRSLLSSQARIGPSKPSIVQYPCCLFWSGILKSSLVVDGDGSIAEAPSTTSTTVVVCGVQTTPESPGKSNGRNYGPVGPNQTIDHAMSFLWPVTHTGCESCVVSCEPSCNNHLMAKQPPPANRQPPTGLESIAAQQYSESYFCHVQSSESN